jgi:NADH:ubiquinone oxidoreductase subunit H
MTLVVYKTYGLTAEELKQGYDWSYSEFYSWKNIFKSSFGHDNLKQQLAHLLYMGGWKKFEPFWNFMIQYGNLNRMLPVLEKLLANTGDKLVN